MTVFQLCQKAKKVFFCALILSLSTTLWASGDDGKGQDAEPAATSVVVYQGPGPEEASQEYGFWNRVRAVPAKTFTDLYISWKTATEALRVQTRALSDAQALIAELEQRNKELQDKLARSNHNRLVEIALQEQRERKRLQQLLDPSRSNAHSAQQADRLAAIEERSNTLEQNVAKLAQIIKEHEEHAQEIKLLRNALSEKEKNQQDNAKTIAALKKAIEEKEIALTELSERKSALEKTNEELTETIAQLKKVFGQDDHYSTLWKMIHDKSVPDEKLVRHIIGVTQYLGTTLDEITAQFHTTLQAKAPETDLQELLDAHEFSTDRAKRWNKKLGLREAILHICRPDDQTMQNHNNKPERLVYKGTNSVKDTIYADCFRSSQLAYQFTERKLGWERNGKPMCPENKSPFTTSLNKMVLGAIAGAKTAGAN